ncbi:MAG: hypothetical protein ABI763_11525 [Bacteroidota bacterium]
MGKLLIKCLFLCLVVLTASIGLSALYKRFNPLPYSFASGTLHFKTTYLQTHSDSINTLFAGSSRVMREIDPHLFDSLVDSSLHIKSFNYGVNWLAASELFYFIDKLTNDSSVHLKYIFIELSKIKFVDFPNLNTTRVTHWYNPHDYWFTINSTLHSNSSILVKAASTASNSVSFISHLLNLGYVSTLNDFSATKKITEEKMKQLGNTYDGFGGMEGVAGKDVMEKSTEENVLNRTTRFLKNTNGLTLRKKWSQYEFTKFEKQPALLDQYNPVYLERLNQMTDQLMSKGIYPVFLITPRSEKEQYEELLPIYAHLPAQHKIEICDSRKYPELYAVENSLDETHLNKKGARILTKILAEKFSQIHEPLAK